MINKLNIFCLNWGTKYTNDWNDRLYLMCKQYINIPFDFYVYTDTPYEHNDYKCVEIPESDEYLEAWFHKLGLFNLKEAECSDGEWNIFFDLDLFFYKDLDSYIEKWVNDVQIHKKEIGIAWNPISMGRTKDGKHKGWNAYNFNTSIMVWNKNEHMQNVYNIFMKDEFHNMINFTGLDMFLSSGAGKKSEDMYNGIVKLRDSFKRVHHDYYISIDNIEHDAYFFIQSDSDTYKFYFNDYFPLLSFNGISFNKIALTTSSNKNNQIIRTTTTEKERYDVFNKYIKQFDFSLMYKDDSIKNKTIRFEDLDSFLDGKTW